MARRYSAISGQSCTYQVLPSHEAERKVWHYISVAVLCPTRMAEPPGASFSTLLMDGVTCQWCRTTMRGSSQVSQAVPETDALLAKRGETHGDWAVIASVTQEMKTIVRDSWVGPPATHSMSEALDMIVQKIARITAGDATHVDHWDDIAGYARLAAQQIRGRC